MQGTMTKKRRKFKMPHAFIILFSIIVIVTIMTYIVPAGSFTRVVDETTGITKVDPDSFQYENQTPVNVFDMFRAIPIGFTQISAIAFLVFAAYFAVYTVIKTGTFKGAVSRLIIKIKGREQWLIPIFMGIFGLAGSTYGAMDSIYGFIPLFVGLSIALGYDAIVGLSITGMSIAIGFASATANPYTIGIAQTVAELPMYSGIGFRWIVFVIFMGVGIWWTTRYAKKIKANPELSLVKDLDYSEFALDEDEMRNSEFTLRHKLVGLTLILGIFTIVITSITLGWYIHEQSAVFLITGIIAGLIYGYSPSEVCETFVEASKKLVMAVMVVGMSRAILVILTQGNIVDTIINGLYLPLKNAPDWFGSVGMVIVQNIINLFIPSGSGQATAIMPIMVPLADLMGINRQVAVLAYQFGDGFSNLLWPTGLVIIITGIANIPLNKWYKYFVPLFGIIFIVQAALIIIANLINYGPF